MVKFHWLPAKLVKQLLSSTLAGSPSDKDALTNVVVGASNNSERVKLFLHLLGQLCSHWTSRQNPTSIYYINYPALSELH